MYDFMYKNKGAISIFLVIVLIPMLVFSSIFVDMSRINLAKSVAESSGELTLNTALTNYDAVLKDMYGLFATSQDTDELFENLENYYIQCIEAAGVAEADADNYVDQIMQFIKSETGTDDMLNMNLTSFEVTKPTGGSLANPAVLKSQIVEFMKYRGPINLGTGIFDALSSLKNVKKQTQLVDNKNKFYDQQTSMMEKLESVWSELEDYQYRDAFTMYKGDKCTFPDGQYLLKSYERMNDCVPMLKTSVAYVVRYLYFANSNFNILSSGVQNFGVAQDTNPSDDDYTEIWKVTQTDTNEYKIEAEPSKTSVSTLKADLKTAFAAVQALEKQNALVDQLMQGNSNMSTTEKIKIVVNFKSSLGSGYHANIKNMVQALVELKNSMNGCEDDLSKYYVIENTDSNGNKSLSFTEDSEESGAKPLAGFINEQFSHLSTTSGHIYQYNDLVSRVHTFWTESMDVVINARSYVKSATQAAETYAWTFDSFLEGKIKKLDNALGTLSTIKSELSNSESDYNKALAAWKSSANGLSGETIGDNDLSEIAKLEKVLTVAKVEALYTRVQSAKTSLESLRNQVGQFKVLGKAWKELENNGAISYNTLQNLLTTDQKNSIANVAKSSNTGTENIDGATAIYDKAYDSVVTTLQAKVESTVIKTEWAASEAAKSPNLTKNQVELYTWLYNNFYDEASVKARFDTNKTLDNYTPAGDTTTSTDVSSNKDKADKPQDGMEDKANGEDGYNNKNGASIVTPNRPHDTSFLPSGEWEKIKGELYKQSGNSDTSLDSDAMLSSSTDALSTLDGVMDLVGNMATTLRDDLYICNYIMNMFSYSTYEAEIAVANDNEASPFASWYEWSADENKYKLKSDFSTDYSNSSQMLKDARTLTKVSINPNANYLYGQEVEYIIYGDGGVAKSYGTIYMLRFALNTVYAFTDAQIGNITTAAATALFGTPPLTPLIPVAKIAMTIGLALAESAYDLYQLKCGDEIPLMKNNNTWVMKPSSAAKAVAGEIIEYAVVEAIDQGVKVLNDALEMTDEELQKLINEGGDAFENLEGAATENTIKEIKNYGNQAVQEIVNICNNVTSEAMEHEGYQKGQTSEKISAAIQKLDAWLATQGSSTSDVVYLAKKTAVDYLKQNNGEAIGELFDAIDNVSGVQSNEDLADLINRKLGDIQTAVDKKIDDLSEQAGNALSEFKNSAMQKLKDAAAQGAESLRNSLKEQIGAAFGTSSSKGTGTNNVVSSLLSWQYSDYLQLFLLIGIVASPESILLRTADVIELNMQQIDGNLGYIEVTTEKEVSRLWGLIKYTETETTKQANAAAFKLSNSYTYLNVKATIEVKPMMLTLPLLGDTVKSQLTGTNWYQITYEGTMGY